MAARSLPRRVLYVAVLLALGGGVIEGFCRLAERATDVLLGPFEIDVVPDVLGFDPHHEIGHLDLTTYANEGGYNGPFRPTDRAPGTFRVAVLGDSFTFGWGVQAEEAWPALLEERLAAGLAGTGVTAEVLNFGVPGYNTWLQLLHWQRVVSRYTPDAVLLGYYSNDAVIDRRVPNVYALCPLEPPRWPALFAAAQERSAIVRVAHDLYWVARAGSPLAPWGGPEALQPGNYGFRCSIEWAAMLASDVEATGASFAVVQLPHMEDLDDPGDGERAAQERLRSALEERGITTDDAYPGLAGLDPADVINADKHPNVAGNRAILEALWPVTGQWLLAQALARASGPTTGSSGTPRDR
jgi:lysophospholipase L1-like esterase